MPDDCRAACYDTLMSDYRRYFVPGGTYFFTLVTERRSRLFASAAARRLLGNVMRRWIKREFTRDWLALGGAEQVRGAPRTKERRRGVWQRRFWEHTIRDEADLEAHFDYIHYNPVKHALVPRPRDWPWSTFHRWVRDGHYSIDWAAGRTGQPLPGNAGE